MTINQAIAHYGSVAKLAEVLRLSPKSVYAWVYRGRRCPPEVHQWRLQEMTGGRLKKT